MISFSQGFQLVPHWAYLIVIAWLGAMVGSFLNCFIYRWPRRISVWKKKRSFCPRCKAQIAWYDNFPLLSWLVLRARCRHCKEPIHWIYPLIEALTAGLFALTYYTFRMLNSFGWPVVAVYLALISALIALSFVDCQVHRIPNEITLPGMPLALVLSAAIPGLHRFQPGTFRFFSSGIGPPGFGVPHFVDSFLAALQWGLISGGCLFALAVLWRWMRGVEAMGFGDVKLMFMVGALLGHYGFIAIPVAATAGSIVFAGGGYLLARARHLFSRERQPFDFQMRIAFGPLLAIGTVLMLFWGPLLISSYMRMIAPLAAPIWLDYICPLWDTAYL